MTPAELREEIEAGPLAGELKGLVAAGDDAGVAARLNRRDYRGPVPIEVLAAYCCRAGVTGGVMALLEIPLAAEIAPGVPMTLQLKGMLHTVLTLIQLDYRLTTADVDDPAFGAACDGLVQLGVMTGPQKADLLALAAGRRSRGDVLWGGGPSGDGVAVTAAAVTYALHGRA